MVPLCRCGNCSIQQIQGQRQWLSQTSEYRGQTLNLQARDTVLVLEELTSAETSGLSVMNRMYLVSLLIHSLDTYHCRKRSVLPESPCYTTLVISENCIVLSGLELFDTGISMEVATVYAVLPVCEVTSPF